jgi:HECT-domain (ubiquitin-transferase)
LNNEVSVLDLTFSYEEERFGQRIQKDLIPNGINIAVTDENKKEYVNKICYAKMATEIKDQIEAFLTGLFEIVPKSLLQIFDHRELELMISGVSEINIEDLKQNTNYVNYSRKSEVIVWFWEILESWGSEQRANFIQFVTGTSKVPIEGFKALKGIGGEI